ncbi:MAG: protein translocase subunit SecF [Acidobacteria bacterium]|nr:protein translocase subunit SecF [Acidobacteriota bacterium]
MRILTNPNFNFIKWRWHALGLSIAVILAGLATIAAGGLRLGIDFSGGTVVVMQFEQATSEDAVRQALGPLGSDAVVQRYGGASGTAGAQTSNAIMVRLPQTGTQEQNLDQDAKRIDEAMRAANIGAYKVISREIVGPTVGRDLQRKGIWATLAALGGILLYIAFRFRFSFAVGAIAATFHDILVTLVFLTWFGYDLSLNVIAAILTIAGYSVNDTIVIFDRVRENQRQVRREALEDVVNRSVNQTLGRTIITAGTTFLAVVALFLFGGDVLRGFAFTMLVGIVTGTYSTVFIASAIAIMLSRRGSTVQTTATRPAADAPRRRRRA